MSFVFQTAGQPRIVVNVIEQLESRLEDLDRFIQIYPSRISAILKVRKCTQKLIVKFRFLGRSYQGTANEIEKLSELVQVSLEDEETKEKIEELARTNFALEEKINTLVEDVKSIKI
jgi:hypothetical protein